MEGHPEEDHDGEHQAEADDALLGLGLGKLGSIGGSSVGSLLVALAGEDVLVGGAEGVVDSDTDDQRYASHGKGEVVGIGLADAERGLSPLHDLDGSGRGEHGTDVDGHIEQRETGVALRGIVRTVIETTHHHLEVTLEETRTQGNEDERQTHCGNGNRVLTQRQREHQVAEEHDKDTRGDHTAKAKLVGSDTTNDGQEIDHHEEGGVDRTCRTSGETEVCLQIEQEHSQHRVVAEALACVCQS